MLRQPLVLNRRFLGTAVLKACASLWHSSSGSLKTFVFLPLLLAFLGVGSALAQSYAGGAPGVGTVYRILTRHDNGTTVVQRPMWNNGTNPTLASGIAADDVDGYWLLKPTTGGGHYLLSGSGDGKVFNYVHGGTDTMSETGTLFTGIEAGVKPNTTALKFTDRYISTNNSATAISGMFDRSSVKSSSSSGGWTTDFLLEEVAATRYDVVIYGLTSAQQTTAGVKYPGYSSYRNADGQPGIPNGGFFLFAAAPDVSQFTATVFDGETPHILMRGTTIEVYYRQSTLTRLNEMAAVSALFPESGVNTLRAAVENHPWGTSHDDAQAALTFFDQQLNTAYSLADGRIFHLRNALYSTYYLRANSSSLAATASTARTANDIFYLAHQGSGIYRVMAYRTNGADQPFPNTGSNSQGINLPAAAGGLAGRYTLDLSPARTTPGRMALVCQNPSDPPHNGVHVNGSYNIVVWNATAQASQWIVEAVSDTVLVQPYRSAVSSFYQLPALYAAKMNASDFQTLNALRQDLNGRAFATIAEVRQAQADARTQIETFCRTAEGRFFFFQNGGTGSWANFRMRHQPTATDAEGDRALTGNNIDAYHYKTEVFRVELDAIDANYRPVFQVYSLTAAAYFTPTGAEWSDIVFSNTEKGTYRLEPRDAANRIVFFCTNGTASYNNALLHLENSGDISTWNNAADAKSQWLIVPIDSLLLDGHKARFDQMRKVPLLYTPAQLTSLRAELDVLTFATAEELDAALTTADQHLEAAYSLADGQPFYFLHETGARYASATATATDIRPKATGTGVPGLTELFYLNHLGQGIYSIHHLASGKALVRTEADNAPVRLMGAGAVLGHYRLVTTTTDNRVGIEAQNATNANHPWWHSPDNTKIVPWEKNSGNSLWDIVRPEEPLVDAAWSTMMSAGIPTLGMGVGQYRERNGVTRTQAEVRQSYTTEWDAAAVETEEAVRLAGKAAVFQRFIAWRNTQLTLNMPQTGMFYRFTSIASTGRALQSPAGTTGLFTLATPTAESEPGNIFYLAPDGSLLSPVTGRYAKGASLVDPSYSHDHFSFSEGRDFGRSIYLLSPQQGVFLSGSGTTVSILQSATAATTGWTVEQIDKFPVSFRILPDAAVLLGNAARSVSTLFCPCALDIPDGVRAYRATLNAARTEVVLTEITEFIPASTPVVVEGDAGTTVLFPIRYNDTTAAPADNVLLGSEAALDSPGVFTLQSPTSTQQTGFYPYNGMHLVGFRAYLPTITVFGATHRLTLRLPGLTAVGQPLTDGGQTSPIYDLSGRRVQQLRPGGIYLNGGQKVIGSCR